MVKFLLIGFMIFVTISHSYGQYLTNPSFENTTIGYFYACNISIAGWNTCNGTPDIQPGYWCMKLPPFQGNSYLGLASQSALNGGESIGQELSDSLKIGIPYTFSAAIADSDSNFGKSGNDTPPPSACQVPISLQGSILQLWGNTKSNCVCTKPRIGTILWQSDTVRTTTWKTYSGTFVPDSNYRFIRLEVISKNVRSVNGQPIGGNLVYLKVDNLKLYAGTVTSLINGDQNPQANTPPQLSIFDRLGKWVRLVFD